MRLTLEQDYSIRIVYELFRNGGLMDVGQVSEKTGVTKLFTQKILRKLCKAEITESKKGAYGGFIIKENLTPEDVSLYDVLLATEEDGLFINACLGGEYTCTRPEVIENGGECYIRKAMNLLNESIKDSLTKVTFDKILKS